MGYFESMPDSQRARVMQVAAAMRSLGIRNKYLLAGILAVISKESAFHTVAEVGYQTTNNDRIRRIFSSRLGSMGDEALDKLKADPRKFFNKVYDNRIGNGTGEGYLFRGRGLNQITGRANYEAIGKRIGIDLAAKPDKLLDLDVASRACAAYFLSRLERCPAELRRRYSFETKDDFRTLRDGAMAAYHANAGWGKSQAEILADSTGGLALTMGRASGFLQMVEGGVPATRSSAPSGGTLKPIVWTAATVLVGAALLGKKRRAA